MDVTRFYTTDAKDAATLVFLSKAEWAASASFNALDALRLKTENFQGKLGDVTTVFDEKGQLIKAYIGTESGNITQALIMALAKLPPVTYKTDITLSQDAMLSFSLAQYRYDKYKANGVPIRVLVVPKACLASLMIEAKATCIVRDLINAPTNDMGPSELEAASMAIASQFSATCEVIKGDALFKGFPAIHAVGRAAQDAPRLISMAWGQDKHPKVTLVGKGVCFDSGGLDIKPSSAMRLMKKDMGGAAHVLGLAYWIMAKKLPIRLRVLIPAVENAISSNAYRPGDILTMRNGMTVEIDNTDAEGRLVLADALTYACEEKPDLVIDYATLTGAARVAVGTDMAAMFTNEESLAESLQKTSALREDPLWRMPLFAPYNSLFDSTVADMMNSSASPYAGAIVAALFLQRFVTNNTPWIHFDVMAWNVGARPGKPEGGEAMAVRAVAHYLENMAES